MANSNYCYLYLTCENKTEANKIVRALLDKRLIVCAKQLPISAQYHWQGKIESGKEALLIMESRLDLFSEVEKLVDELHSYDTFVLEAVPISKVSHKAKQWMQKELRQ